MVDTSASKADAERRAGSSPATGTRGENGFSAGLISLELKRVQFPPRSHGEWCNGSTLGSGPRRLGSNPSPPIYSRSIIIDTVYKGRQHLKEKARALRSQNLSHRQVYDELEGAVPLSTIAQWVRGLGVDCRRLNIHRPARKTPEEVFTSRTRHRSQLHRALQEIDVPYICDVCGIGPEWNDAPLILPIDHVNGVSDDNRSENLRYLCPNCHSQTPTFCSKNHRPRGAT